MLATPFPYPIYEFRLFNYQEHEVLRYAFNTWAPDNGQYDLAFIVPEISLAIYIDLPYRFNLKWHLTSRNDSLPFKDNHYHHYRLSYSNRGYDWDNCQRSIHPNVVAGSLAMSKLCSIKGCANGYNVDVTNPKDPYLLKGLVREYDTKKVIIPPKSIICSYCGRRIQVCYKNLKPSIVG